MSTGLSKPSSKTWRSSAACCARSRSHSQARHDHHHQHQRSAGRENCRRLLRRLPPLLVRHALLQSAALHAPAGADSHARRRSCRDGDHRALLRSAPGQGRGLRQGHAELHRQPHRHVLHPEHHAPDAGDGPEHRRSRRADRNRRRLAEDRDFPPGRSRRPRHSRTRRAQRH